MSWKRKLRAGMFCFGLAMIRTKLEYTVPQEQDERNDLMRKLFRLRD
jgi:hypothetical protein